MRWLAALLCLLALPAAATQDAWPALYDVVDVAANDVLNIREGPNAQAPIIGRLAHDAEAVELIRPDDSYRWALVNSGEGRGWVSLHYLQRRPGQWAGAMPQLAQCAGTEPFWSLEVEGATVSYRAIDAAPQGYDIVQKGPAQGRRDSFHLIAERAEGLAVGALSTEACSDGMSDRAYGLSIELLMKDATGWQHVSGCCSLSR
ncbi:COG3650 family protein [Sulfitobacter sp. PS-8MA]|uniref:COG3650 family protein n=1 Tax=Sulfitobacter sp. PS-8MA TaxID=3237707 RepID=UPI0034C5E2B5